MRSNILQYFFAPALTASVTFKQKRNDVQRLLSEAFHVSTLSTSLASCSRYANAVDFLLKLHKHREVPVSYSLIADND